MNKTISRRSSPSSIRDVPFLLILAILLASCGLPFMQSGTPVPTPQCVEPTLTLGSLSYRVESIARETDGFPKIPKRNKDVAFWVEGTTINYVFGFSPTKDNLALDASLKAGDPITINWADCSTDGYVVKSVDAGQQVDSSIFDQSSGGITIYVQGKSGTLIIRGERPIVQSEETPAPLPENTIQIDLQILDFTQPDDQTLSFRIMVTNQGAQTITLTDKDIALVAADGSETPPQTMTPELPQELRPGDIIPLTMTFSKPQGTSAVLRIFDVTFEEYFQ